MSYPYYNNGPYGPSNNPYPYGSGNGAPPPPPGSGPGWNPTNLLFSGGMGGDPNQYGGFVNSIVSSVLGPGPNGPPMTTPPTYYQTGPNTPNTPPGPTGLTTFNGTIPLPSGVNIGDVKTLLGRDPNDPTPLTAADIQTALDKMNNGSSVSGKDSSKIKTDLQSLVTYLNKQNPNGDKTGNDPKNGGTISDFSSLKLPTGVTATDIKTLMGTSTSTTGTPPSGGAVSKTDIESAIKNLDDKAANASSTDATIKVGDPPTDRKVSDVRKDLMTIYTGTFGGDPKSTNLNMTNTDTLKTMKQFKDEWGDVASGGGRDGRRGHSVGTMDGLNNIIAGKDAKGNPHTYDPRLVQAAQQLHDNPELWDRLNGHAKNVGLDDKDVHVKGMAGRVNNIGDLLEDKDVDQIGNKDISLTPPPSS
jgi:hypothetical protein